MYTIEFEKECSCLKKSNLTDKVTFDSREDMINRARVMECLMNQNFCMTHFFEAVDYGEKIVIHSSIRPEDDEEDDDIEDSNVLVAKSCVTIGFDGSQEPPKDSGSN